MQSDEEQEKHAAAVHWSSRTRISFNVFAAPFNHEMIKEIILNKGQKHAQRELQISVSREQIYFAFT